MEMSVRRTTNTRRRKPEMKVGRREVANIMTARRR